jgi:phage terminase small subunit
MRLLPPPKDFEADERDVWNAAQKQLRAQGTWTGRSDVPLLESYCRNVVLARGARVEARTWGLQTSSSGQLLAATKLKVAAECEAAAHKYATALLLTPESRKRHGIKASGNGAEDELAALVA